MAESTTRYPAAVINSAGEVYFDDHQVPGHIAANGITVQRGSPHLPNTVTVTFLCGPVRVDDPTA